MTLGGGKTMIQDKKMEILKMHSPNLTGDNVERIRELFPGCVVEVRGEDGTVKLAVDFDQLRQELSDAIVEGPQERYHLNWPGKREALLTANAPIAKTLRPVRKQSVDFDITRNLFIEGDNLDALKLLQETYLGKVKMIYIDPPYNTGKDFIYEDDFSSDATSYLLKSNQVEVSGDRLVVNVETNGRFHSDWLSMIYARLRLARNLLSEDGVIFISIDDNEVDNLRKVCSEVFGEGNFIAQIVWEGANKNDAKQIGVSHEYVLVYAKNRSAVPREWSIRKEGVDEVLAEVARLNSVYGTDYESASKDLAGWFRSMKAKPVFGLRRFRYIDARGAYKEDDPTAPGGRRFQLVNPMNGEHIPLRRNRGWSFDQTEFNRLVEEKRVSFVTPTSIMIRRYLHETDALTPPSVFYQPARSASERLASLLGAGIFDFPKDETVIAKFIEMATTGADDDCIVMDFFAGSATTAHAVMQLNADDGKRRRFVLVQLPEACVERSAAAEAGYRTIADVSKERIRRAADAIRSQGWEGDGGFRVLKIDTSNMADVFYTPDAVTQGSLLGSIDNIKPDRTDEDLLFQVMLDWGVDLALPVEKMTIQGKDVFFVDGDALVACLDAHGGVDEAFVKELATHSPLRVVFRDAGFKDSAVKINVEQIFRLLSPATEVKSI
ncbi:Site-specific DNA-methyltransferase (adenine-specific) [Burkholderia ambifaria IOP40-10]|uniref:site-specific DNA-methyltransferase (adenine-specific) n=1 Tax=Burkholderia ambifaria IOP40-10 TaxID=396596 RepID=B1FA51_9BURK|nr:site-specific DNA-methyltransferase [Burkholderia ambifaria]EDT05617.1 Site-specific DNA-methyltransferase (adenine-specific) [Burkholderia ambifaria IOP40-10]